MAILILQSTWAFVVADGAQASLVLRFHIKYAGVLSGANNVGYDFMDMDPPEYNREAMAMMPSEYDPDAMDVDPPEYNCEAMAMGPFNHECELPAANSEDSDGMDVDVASL